MTQPSPNADSQGVGFLSLTPEAKSLLSQAIGPATTVGDRTLALQFTDRRMTHDALERSARGYFTEAGRRLGVKLDVGVGPRDNGRVRVILRFAPGSNPSDVERFQGQINTLITMAQRPQPSLAPN